MTSDDPTIEAIDEICPPALAGQRVDRVVALLADVSRSAAAELIGSGAVTVDGEVAAKASTRVEEGTRIRFAHERAAPGIEADPSVAVAVVHQDDDVVVVDKPAGLVVHPGAGTHHRTLANGLLARFPELAGVGEPDRPGIVHRLDKGTSGVLMVARTASALTDLSAQLAARTVERRYRTVVLGHVGADQGLVDAPLGRSPRDPSVRAVVVDGRPARTRYRVVRRGWLPSEVAVTELECRLETGRTHQIRAHLAAIDHPVYADTTYGGRPPAPGRFPPGGSTSARLGRPFLHAETLGFDHPRSGERLRFSSPLPADLTAVLSLVVDEEPVVGDDPERTGVS